MMMGRCANQPRSKKKQEARHEGEQGRNDRMEIDVYKNLVRTSAVHPPPGGGQVAEQETLPTKVKLLDPHGRYPEGQPKKSFFCEFPAILEWLRRQGVWCVVVGGEGWGGCVVEGVPPPHLQRLRNGNGPSRPDVRYPHATVPKYEAYRDFRPK